MTVSAVPDRSIQTRAVLVQLAYRQAADKLDTLVEDARDEGWSFENIRTVLTMSGIPPIMIDGSIAGQMLREVGRVG